MESIRHRFAAILAADIARFSAHIESDAEGTVRALDHCGREFQRCIAAHHGRQFGSVGDSFMAEFDSPIEALRAAFDIQASFHSAVAALPDDQHLECRIGLHAGDVIHEGDNLFGDSVNIASRIQGFVRPGGIGLSAFMYELVHKNAGLVFHKLGRYSLKNIGESVVIYEVTDEPQFIAWRRIRLALSPYRTTLAMVIGAFAAAMVIVGWLETHTAVSFGGVIEVLPPDEILQSGRPPDFVLDSHAQFTLGIAELGRGTPESLERARKHFNNAIRYDPNNALAYVGLADTLAMMPASVGDPDVMAVIDKALQLAPRSGEAYASLASLNLSRGKLDEAEAFIQRAIELNPQYAQAYRVYSRISLQRGEFDQGLAQSRRALELDPGSPVLIRDVADWSWRMGRVEESQAVLKEGLSKYPDFPFFYADMAEQKAMTGRWGEALVWYDRAVSMSPGSGELQAGRCYVIMTLGNADQAKRCIDMAANLDEFQELRLQVSLNRLRGRDADNRSLVEPYLARNDLSLELKHLFGCYFQLYGFEEAALDIYREIRPEYLGEGEIRIRHADLRRSFWAGRALYVNGYRERANYIFDRMLAVMASVPSARGGARGSWDYLIHHVRGDAEKIKATAEQARENGFRDPAWWDMKTAATPADPEGLAAAMAHAEQERLWYEAHHGDPLF